MSTAITWLDTAILVRVETTADGWALDEVLARLLGLPWRLVHVDRVGLRGVLEGGEDGVAQLGALTSAVQDLDIVEVRDDVAVALISTRDRTAVAAAIGEALGGQPVGLFIDAAGVGVAIERWHRDALAAALRTATSLSG